MPIVTRRSIATADLTDWDPSCNDPNVFVSRDTTRNKFVGRSATIAVKTTAGTTSGNGIEMVDSSVISYSTTVNPVTGGVVVTATTITTTAGRWLRPMILDPGDYVLLCYKAQSYAPVTFNLTVS